MLKEITSLFDFFKKVETNKEYELVAIYAYCEDGYNPSPYTYESAKNWINKWNCGEDTCEGMVLYLNGFVRKMNDPQENARMVHRLSELNFKQKVAEESLRLLTLDKLDKERIAREIQQLPGGIYPNIPPTMTTIDWTTIAQQYTTQRINPNLYGTITIDNGGAHFNTNEPAATTPQPPIENIWADFETLPGTIPAVGVPLAHTPRPGDMVEYGWYDQEIENEIETLVHQQNLSREDAIVRVFNEDGNHTRIFNEDGNHTPPIVLPDEDDWETDLENWEGRA